jgi:hypothetical protein
MIQDKIFFDEKDPTGVSYNTPFTVYGSYEGRLWSKTPSGTIKYYTQNSDLSVYATTGSNQFSSSQTVTGSLTVTGGITGSTTTASYVEYTGVANKPTLVSGSAQVTYSGLTGVPAGIVSSSAQVGGYGIFATTGSNQFNGSQAVTGSLTVTGQVVAQTLNVQQVTSSIVYSSGSNIFGNSLDNTQQFTGSVSMTGSLTVNGAGTFANSVTVNGASATTSLNIKGSGANGILIDQNLADATSSSRLFFKMNTQTYAILADSNGLNFMTGATAGSSSGSPKVTINSTGSVGIGTTSPVSPLHQVTGGGAYTGEGRFGGSDNAFGIELKYTQAASTSGSIYCSPAYSSTGILFKLGAGSGNTNQLVLKGDGNIGIGTTNPVANDGTSRTLQLGNRLTIQNVIGTQFLLGTNVYYDGTWKYIAAAKAQAVRGTGESGAIQFSLSPTGTIGGTVTNMDSSDIKMIILDTGNVGIGTTTPATLLNLKSSTTTELRLESIGGTYRSFIGFRTDGQKYDLGVNLNDTLDSLSINYAGTERLRITSNAIVDMTACLVVRGTLPADQTSAAVIDHLTSKMRIFSYGASGTTGTFEFRNAAGGAGSNLVATINASGVYTAVSDINKKKDFEDSIIGLDAILGLKPTLYRMRNDESEGNKELGFIAQEVKEFIPQAYVESGEDDDKFIGLNYNAIVATLVKSVQELKSENDTLKSILQRNNIS